MLITIEVSEAHDSFGMIAAKVSDVRGDVPFKVADRLNLGDLYRKIENIVDEHLNAQLNSRSYK